MAQQAAYITVIDRRILYETEAYRLQCDKMQPLPTQFEVRAAVGVYRYSSRLQSIAGVRLWVRRIPITQGE